MGISRTICSIAAACGAVIVTWLVLASPAPASTNMQTVLQDDPKILFEDDPARLDRTLGQIASLGVDSIRVSVFWHLVVPNPKSRRRPHFGPGGPGFAGSYGEWRWQRYDRIVKLAERHGLSVFLSPSGPVPRWAAGGRGRDVNNVRPSARDFREFVAALGGRYSGSYPDPSAPSTSGQHPRLPRVTHWSIWNEPNFPSWLLPQWKRRRRSYRPVSPGIYRRLVDAAWSGLRRTGHGGDVILLGETAPYGPRKPRRPGTNGLVSPLSFVRELYCVNHRYRPYRGRAAGARGCPANAAGRRRFRSRHPGLFHASGWAHHAYSLTRPPTFKGRRRDAAPVGALYRLTRTLDRSQRRWGRRHRWPIWITEYGYQTRPPDPFKGVRWDLQATWMSWAEYLMYGNPRVASFAQFLLVDDAPRPRAANGEARWATWQSGLFTTGGRAKPALNEFRHPIHVTPARARRGRSARVFGIYRTAPYGVPIDARIEFARPGGSFQPLAVLTVTNRRGYLLRRVRPPGTGFVRIVWLDPMSGDRIATRAQFVKR